MQRKKLMMEKAQPEKNPQCLRNTRIMQHARDQGETNSNKKKNEKLFSAN
jgi:hypothetical protein